MWLLIFIMAVGCIIMEWPLKPKKKNEKEEEDGSNGKDGDT